MGLAWGVYRPAAMVDFNVGEGRRGVEFPEEVLTGLARDPRVKVMPAHGLCLVEVEYPAEDALAARAVEARARRED